MSPRPAIRTTATRVVYRSRWLTLREDAIEYPDGTTGVYGVVDKPDFALVIPFDGGGFHLVEQYRYPVRRRCLEFPQGSWPDAAGADPAELARGELEEETGLRAGRLRHLGHLYHAYGFCSQGLDVWLAEDLQPGEQRLEPSEQDLEVRRVTVAELERMILAGELKDGPSVAAYGLLRLGARHAEPQP